MTSSTGFDTAEIGNVIHIIGVRHADEGLTMSGAKGTASRLTGLDTAFLVLENDYSQMHTLKFAVFE